MHFGFALAPIHTMQVKELIEDVIISEVKGLCVTCAHADSCVYYKTATKSIIQCELFELDNSSRAALRAPKGLCKTCDLATRCKLPGRLEGLWHCNEFI
jgi:hypothetical protein